MSRQRLGVALVLCAVVGLAPARGADAPSRLNGPGAAEGGRVAVGNLAISSPGNCVLDYSLQVQTETGSGNDTFELRIYDEGALIQTAMLAAPADGAVHTLAASLQLGQPVSQNQPGVGVYLVDSGSILDFVDPADVVCGVAEIPALDALGTVLLGGLLFASAFYLIRRQRRAA